MIDKALVYLSNIPQFVWEAVANFLSVLLAGLIIAFVTTFYLKKKDESTRVAGVILEKRIEAQQEILHFMERSTQKFELRKQEAEVLRELVLSHDMPLPYDPHIQYAEIFSSIHKFREFFIGLEAALEKHKLWLDLKVRHQVLCMQTYFASINALTISFNRLPLPNKVKLTESDFNQLGDRLLLILGAVLDEEFNHLVMELETLMVASIYKLDLSRPKTGFFAKRYAGKEVKRVKKFLYQDSLLGVYIRKYPILIIQLLQAYKGIEITLEDAADYYEAFASSPTPEKQRSFL